MLVKDYKDLFIWKQAIDIAKNSYKVTKQFPKSELYGISSQIQRAAVSIPSNIAEGYNRKNRKEYIQFLYIANGSAAELETQIIICESIYPNIDVTNYLNDISDIRGLLRILINKLNEQ